jgi:hypothetical protein
MAINEQDLILQIENLTMRIEVKDLELMETRNLQEAQILEIRKKLMIDAQESVLKEINKYVIMILKVL